jgi:DNA-directed RNA polymerase specialized sigma24 family protein
MSHESLDTDARELAEDAAEWLSVLEGGSAEDRIVFVAWLKKSPDHVAAILHMMELDEALSAVLPRKSVPQREGEPYPTPSEAQRGPIRPPQKELDTYRRAIVQMLIQRHIDRDSAEDLFQELWVQVLEDNRIELLTNSDKLSGYLYRAARERVLALRRSGLSWVGGHKPSLTGRWEAEEPSPLEEHLGHRQLVRCARDLMFRTPISPDRRVLELLFLHPEPDRDAGHSIGFTDAELGHAVWRARLLFTEIVRERGVNLSDPESRRAKDVRTAALYVAGALESKIEERAFELRMVLSPRCAAEVDIWRALKRGMAHVERRRDGPALTSVSRSAASTR